MSEEDRTKRLDAMLGVKRAQARKAVAMLKHLLVQSTFEIIPNRVSSDAMGYSFLKGFVGKVNLSPDV